ncbi:hypothetical protein, partial [Azospirillum sp. B506]|uniref:hypothetical protein n=1 Tax=Azospirillum sp. B506 TaxID=137721 RepID=UPI0035D3EC0A
MSPPSGRSEFQDDAAGLLGIAGSARTVWIGLICGAPIGCGDQYGGAGHKAAQVAVAATATGTGGGEARAGSAPTAKTAATATAARGKARVPIATIAALAANAGGAVLIR